MAKYKKTLNDSDRFYITGNPEMSVSKLSKTLKTAAATIKDFRDTLDVAPEHITTISKSKDEFHRRGSAVVMTEAESGRGDKETKRSKPEYMKTCVFEFRKNQE